MRIRGQIGDWPVDLTIELAPEEWAQLGRQIELPAVAQTAATETVATTRQDDGQWTAAREVLRLAGQMSGPELARRLASRHPETRILYISGFSDDALGQFGDVAPETNLLQKPFTLPQLARRIREVLRG